MDLYFCNCNIYLFKIQQHVELLLLGHFALVQCRVGSSAGVHQTAVAVVLVRFDSTDVEFSIGAIITVLHQKTIIHQEKNTNQNHRLCAYALNLNIPEVCSSGMHMQWECSQVLGLGQYIDLVSGHSPATSRNRNIK